MRYGLVLFLVFLPMSIWATPTSYYLTIWSVHIQNQHPYGTWDYNSLPDPVIHVFHHDEFIKTLPKQKDQLTPQWNMVVASFDEDDLSQGAVELHVYDQDLLDRELIEVLLVPTPRKEIIGKNLVLTGSFISVYLQWQYSVDDHVLDLSNETVSYHQFPQWIPQKLTAKKSPSQTSTPKSSESSTIKATMSDDLPIKNQIQSKQLFQKYLQAYFEGDQLYAHQILLKLAVHFSSTTHGKKAKRILLLASH